MPGRSAERQRLADAIDRRTATADMMARIKAAQGPAWDRIDAAERTVEEAAEALRHAREVEPARLVARLIGETPTNTSVANAEAAARVAQTELDKLRVISAALFERERVTADDLSAADAEVRRAIPPVVRSELAVFAARVARARQTLLVASEMNSVLPPGAMPLNWDLHPTVTDHSRVQADWRAAVAALADDPDAPLPGGKSRPRSKPLIEEPEIADDGEPTEAAPEAPEQAA